MEDSRAYLPLLRQTWTVSGVLLTMIGQGMILSYPYVFIPGLEADDSGIKTDPNTRYWLASMIGPAILPGVLYSAVVMDIWGRKVAQASANVLGILGWLLIYFATDVPALIAGRFICGMSCGSGVTLGAVMIGEYSSPKYRGMFLMLKSAFVCLGYSLLHITGHFYSWRKVSIFGLVIYTTAFVMVFTWRESPAWLATKNKLNQSQNVWFWLRGYDDKSRTEFDIMISAQKQRNPEVGKKLDRKVVVNFLYKFTENDFVKPSIIMFASGMLLEASGRHYFPAYAIKIMEDITGEKTKSFHYTLVIDLITILSAISSSVLVRMLKRRILLFFTGGISILILIGISTYLYLTSIDLVSKNEVWPPVSMIILYFVVVNLACTVMPLAFLGELYPLVHKSAGSAVSGFILSFWLWISLKVTPELLERVNVYGTFVVFGSAMAVALIVLFFTLPETKDRTLQEIQECFKHEKLTKQSYEAGTVEGNAEKETEMLSIKT